MKTKQPTKQIGKLTNPANVSLKVPKELANAEFINALGKKKDNGANQSSAALFLQVMENIEATKPVFSIGDVQYYSKVFELDPIQVKWMFDKFVEVYSRLNKLTVIEGCMDSPVYVLV
jgi:hypothetical protein